MNYEIIKEVKYEYLYGVCDNEYVMPIVFTITLAITLKIALNIIIAFKKKNGNKDKS